MMRIGRLRTLAVTAAVAVTALAVFGAGVAAGRSGSGPLPGLTATTAELSANDLNSINVTLARYAWGTDNIDYDMLADTLTEDAVLTSSVAGRPTIEMQGRDEITTFVIDTRRAQGDVRRHYITNVAAERDGRNAAIIHAYYVIVKTEGTTVSTLATGIYNMRLVRERDHVWRIEREDVLQDASAT